MRLLKLLAAQMPAFAFGQAISWWMLEGWKLHLMAIGLGLTILVFIDVVLDLGEYTW